MAYGLTIEQKTLGKIVWDPYTMVGCILIMVEESCQSMGNGFRVPYQLFDTRLYCMVEGRWVRYECN